MRRFFCYLIAVSVLIVNSEAQVRVTKNAGVKSAISLDGMSAEAGSPAEFKRTLAEDLKRSGWFRVQGAGPAAYAVSGRCTAGRQLNVECRVYGAADQRLLLSKRYSAPAADAVRLAHQVADEMVKALTGRPGIATTRIIAVGSRTGHKELYLMDYDGQNVRALTGDRTVSLAPAWNPSGTLIFYTSYMKRFPDIVMIELASGHRKIVSNFPGLNTGAAISPDGRTMALILSRDGNPELYAQDLGSGRLTRLTRTGRAAEASPSWSPDGREIVYVSDQPGMPQLYTVARGGGRPTRLRLRGSENVAPDWGPAGEIAYAGKVGGTYQIFTVDPRTSASRQISEGYADYEDPSWARDGRHIVCARTERYHSSICILDTMGDPPLTLPAHGGDWYSPAWSP